MLDASIKDLRKEMEKIRNRLHAVVNGDQNLLIDERAYTVSTELDQLIVKLMKKEMQKKR